MRIQLGTSWCLPDVDPLIRYTVQRQKDKWPTNLNTNECMNYVSGYKTMLQAINPVTTFVTVTSAFRLCLPHPLPLPLKSPCQRCLMSLDLTMRTWVFLAAFFPDPVFLEEMLILFEVHDQPVSSFSYFLHLHPCMYNISRKVLKQNRIKEDLVYGEQKQWRRYSGVL